MISALPRLSQSSTCPTVLVDTRDTLVGLPVQRNLFHAPIMKAAMIVVLLAMGCATCTLGAAPPPPNPCIDMVMNGSFPPHPSFNGSFPRGLFFNGSFPPHPFHNDSGARPPMPPFNGSFPFDHGPHGPFNGSVLFNGTYPPCHPDEGPFGGGPHGGHGGPSDDNGDGPGFDNFTGPGNDTGPANFSGPGGPGEHGGPGGMDVGGHGGGGGGPSGFGRKMLAKHHGKGLHADTTGHHHPPGMPRDFVPVLPGAMKGGRAHPPHGPRPPFPLFKDGPGGTHGGPHGHRHGRMLRGVTVR